jgi:hypothetical protein
MKPIFTFFSLFLCLTLMAQMPKAINYQAVARNAQGQALASQAIKVRLSIVTGPTTVYSETRNVTTNALGLFNIQIGGPGATATTGNFSSINWTNNTSSVEQLKVELDVNNSGSFTEMGTQALATVPYAFSADEAVNALNIGGHYVDTNTPATGDLLRWNGSAWVATSPSALLPKFIPYVGAPNVVSGGNLAFAWAAPPTQVTITAGQKITASMTASLGTQSGTATLVGLGICYQQVGSGPLTHFYGTNYSTDAAISARRTFTQSGTVENLPPGTYNIGFGVRNTSSTALNANGDVAGFIIISNN